MVKVWLVSKFSAVFTPIWRNKVKVRNWKHNRCCRSICQLGTVTSYKVNTIQAGNPDFRFSKKLNCLACLSLVFLINIYESGVNSFPLCWRVVSAFCEILKIWTSDSISSSSHNFLGCVWNSRCFPTLPCPNNPQQLWLFHLQGSITTYIKNHSCFFWFIQLCCKQI